MKTSCLCCNGQAKYSILLTEGPQGNNTLKIPRYYIPNDACRNENAPVKAQINEYWFCAACMRKIEDNFRATILYLQAENGILDISKI